MTFAVSATGGGNARRANDFYETPEAATEALALAYGHILRRGRVWEPSCGAGRLSRVLEAHGVEVYSTDLVDRGFGIGGRDFLAETASCGEHIVTNPPFNLADKFVRKAISFKPGFFALLLKQSFWNAGGRAALWREFPPKDFRPIAWRLDFTGGGSPTMDCAWCIWGSEAEQGRGEPMEKPKVLLSEMLS